MEVRTAADVGTSGAEEARLERVRYEKAQEIRKEEERLKSLNQEVNNWHHGQLRARIGISISMPAKERLSSVPSSPGNPRPIMRIIWRMLWRSTSHIRTSRELGRKPE
jgi:hypothetical protein